MYKINLFARKMVYFIFLTSINFAECWTVKIVNLTDEKITVDIHSSQLYPGLKDGCKSLNPLACITKKECGFIGKQVGPHLSQDLDYKDVNPICIAPCTRSVSITSPIQLSANSTLTSCSDVIVIVSKDKSNKWKIEYHDWTADILKMLEERTRMPLGVRDIYDQFGDSPIQAISVFRQPIMSGINELMKIITKDELKKLNYDDLFHTGFIIKCRDQFIRLERNHTVVSNVFLMKPTDIEQKDIVLPKTTIHYNEFISKAMTDDSDFWKYNPVTNNCQLFVLQCLEKNNIEISDDLRKFIYQDAGKVLAKSPSFKKIAIGATSLANRIDNIVEDIQINWKIKQMAGKPTIEKKPEEPKPQSPGTAIAIKPQEPKPQPAVPAIAPVQKSSPGNPVMGAEAGDGYRWNNPPRYQVKCDSGAELKDDDGKPCSYMSKHCGWYAHRENA